MDSWLIGSLPESDIVVEQPAVSGRHCRLTKTDDGFLLEDLGSTNGTFVNGERITEPRKVTQEDKITLGTKTPLQLPEVEPAATKSSGSGLLASVLIGGMLLAAGGAYAWINRAKLIGEQPDVPEESVTADPFAPQPLTPEPEPAVAREGFRMGTLKPDDAIEQVEVTITVGSNGADLNEPVDLHLGFGFPLRLYPVGSEEREPSFAAFPQTTTIPTGDTIVAAGSNASFRFVAKGQADSGQDILRSTPPLLTDLRVGDIQVIGFACEGDSAWVLEGYKININGDLFASNDSVDAPVLQHQQENRDKLSELLTKAEPLALQVMQGDAYEKAKLANDQDKAELAKARQELAKLERPMNVLRGQTEGIYPWYVEENESFRAPQPVQDAVKTVGVKLLTAGDDLAGSENSIYLKTRGHKYLLASRIDPLTSESEFQEFTIAPDVLQFDPLSRDDLKTSEIGIGMLGHDDPFDRIPDRARVQRVILEVDGAETYDSENHAQDRSTLAAISLIPPVHRDNVGFPVENQSSPYEVYLWKTGMPLPKEKKKEVAPEPKKVVAPTPSQVVNKPKTQGNKKLPAIQPTPSKKTGPFNSRRRPSFPIIVINFPILTSGAVPSLPGPTEPSISDVRIAPGVRAVQFDQPTAVTWKVKGNTSRISSFRVRLYPALPHVGRPFIRPVADTTSTSSGSRRVTLVPQTSLLSRAGIPAAQQPFLYVRPEVTALDVSGRVINGAARSGPIMPIFPGGFPPVRLFRGSAVFGDNLWSVFGLPAGSFLPAFPNLIAPNFASMTPSVGWPFIRSISARDPGAGPAVWTLNGIQVSQSKTFAAYPFHVNGRWSNNTALRPSTTTDEVAMQFVANRIPVPSRLVAHAGFINSPRSNTARVNVEVKMFQTGTPNFLRWIATPVEIVCSRSPRNLALIDIPLASPLPAVGPSSTFGSDPLPGRSDLCFVYQAPPPSGPYGPLPRASTLADVGITITVKQARTPVNSVTGQRQALGVFGVRLVP